MWGVTSRIVPQKGYSLYRKINVSHPLNWGRGRDDYGKIVVLAGGEIFTEQEKNLIGEKEHLREVNCPFRRVNGFFKVKNG